MAQPEIREEHRRLLEKWLYEGLTDEEAAPLPPELLERAAARLRRARPLVLRPQLHSHGVRRGVKPAMQALLAGLGYTRCGEVHGLDEGDPEVFYFRDLNTSQ